jgi:sugar phosphate isomerase/epimerase
MKLGFVSSIMADWSFEEMINTACSFGYECVEVACWPIGGSERRYAGVSHIDVTSLDDAGITYIKKYCRDKNVKISSLAYYPNPLESNIEKRNATIEHLEKVINASAQLDVNMVTTFIGRDQHKTIEENLMLFEEIWPNIIKLAEEKGVKIAIENCPMLFSEDQWPGGQNLATTPAIWRKLFEIIPSKNFGINYDPSHFVWQMMDYIAPIYEFKDRIFHIHFKDIKVYNEKLNNVGTMAYPLEYMAPKLPGLGDVDWGSYVSALTDIGYDGYACVEVEDRAFEGTREKVIDSLELSLRYLKQFVI